MTALDEGNRVDIWAELMRLGEPYAGMVKVDLRAAVDATDDWIEANKSSYNTALPTIARTSLTARQKELLFHAVAKRKFEVA